MIQLHHKLIYPEIHFKKMQYPIYIKNYSTPMREIEDRLIEG